MTILSVLTHALSSQAQEKNYLYLLDLQKFTLAELKDGAVAKDVYAAVLNKIETDRPDLAQYFVKTLGFGVNEFLSVPVFTVH